MKDSFMKNGLYASEYLGLMNTSETFLKVVTSGRSKIQSTVSASNLWMEIKKVIKNKIKKNFFIDHLPQRGLLIGSQSKFGNIIRHGEYIWMEGIQIERGFSEGTKLKLGGYRIK